MFVLDVKFKSYLPEVHPQTRSGSNVWTYDYEFRILNPATERFLSVNPLTKEYPWYTPYQFAGNTVIMDSDMDGLEDEIEMVYKSGEKTITKIFNKIP